jgi:hypothetical protein
MYLAGGLFLRIPLFKNRGLVIIVLEIAEIGWFIELRPYFKGM